MPTSSMRTPSRRMTLGSVPSTQKNRRMSLDAAKTASKPSRPPRKSMIPRVGRENLVPPSPGVTASTAASRGRQSIGGGRQSIGGTGQQHRQSLLPPPVVKSDPRPINDKNFQQQCIKKLLNFLLESGYEYPISHKTLLRPSGKDFCNIVTFMLRCIDPSFQLGNMKLEDEVAMNFKYIGYPYTISKTALVAAGSPHTWPSLLAALTWLMEHLQCLKEDTPENLDETKPFASLEELHISTDKYFFKYLGDTYKAFLHGDAELTEKLEADLADRFERDDGYLEQEIERVTDLNATIVERINVLTQESQDLPTYAKKREDYATDLEQFHDLIRQMDEHKAALEQKVKERTAELAETNAKLDKMNAHVQNLKNMIESQELSVEDIQKMEREQETVNEALDRALGLKEQRRKSLLVSEERLVRFTHDLDSAISDYNSKVLELACIPELGAKFGKSKAALDKDKMLESQSAMLGVDLQYKVRPNALESKKEYEGKADDTKWKYQDALDKLDNSEEDCKEAEYKLKIVEEKYAKCEESLGHEMEAHEAKLAVRQREIEAMENKVASLRDPVALEEQMASYERQCAELEALRIRHQEENVAKKKAVEKEIQVGCQIMIEHEEYYRRKLAELNEYWQKKKAETGKVTVPANIGL